MYPPSYGDLGKKARNIFCKNYNFDLIKVDCKMKTPVGVEFQVMGLSNMQSGRFEGSLEASYCLDPVGVVLREKWTTCNTLATDLFVKDLCFKGVLVGIGGYLAPNVCGKKFLLKSSYSGQKVNMGVDLDVDSAVWLLTASMVAAHQGWWLGARVSANVRSRLLTEASCTLGYNHAGDLILNTCVNNGTEFEGSVYHRASCRLQNGIRAAWQTDRVATKLGYGFVYKLDDSTKFRGSFNNSSQIGLGITHTPMPGIKLHLSTHLNGRTFRQGGHKLGLGLEIEA